MLFFKEIEKKPKRMIDLPDRREGERECVCVSVQVGVLTRQSNLQLNGRLITELHLGLGRR